MRRRPVNESGQVPPILWTFDPAEWSGAPADRVHAWCAARREWARTHPWPGGVVELIQENCRVRGRVPRGIDRNEAR